MGKITINNQTFRNDDGDEVTEEECNREYNLFLKEVDDAYNLKANAIISEINKRATSDLEKLRMLYEYLTAKDMKYDLYRTQDGRGSNDPGYKFGKYKTFKIPYNTKYCVLLKNAGVCYQYSLAFEDLAKRLKIPCRTISGYTGMDHAWNIVLINNEIKHVDIAFALMQRGRDFFLKRFDELGYRRLDPSVKLEELEAEMRKEYLEQHSVSGSVGTQPPKITILRVNDKNTIRGRSDEVIIRGRSDGVKHPKITIYGVSDSLKQLKHRIFRRDRVNRRGNGRGNDRGNDR